MAFSDGEGTHSRPPNPPKDILESVGKFILRKQGNDFLTRNDSYAGERPLNGGSSSNGDEQEPFLVTPRRGRDAID